MRTRIQWQPAVFSILGYFIAFFALFPLIWMAISGFKPESEVLGFPFRFFPSEWTFENYSRLLVESNDFIRAMGITFGGAIVFALVGIAVNSMAAYVFARLEFPFKNVLWVYVIMTMFIPWMAIMIPSYIVVAKLQMLNTLTVLILPGLAGSAHVFFIRQFYLNMPLEMEEAAFIDGASRFKIFYHIFLPLSIPPFVIVGIGMFLGYWNSFVWPIMTITDERLFQVMQLLSFFRNGQNTEWGPLIGGSTIAAIPAIILFLIFQRHIIEGIRISGIK